jgi:predicted transcriptional regulator
MKIKEIKRLIDAQVITGEHLLDTEVDSAFGSDLMSEVLTFAQGKIVLLTGLNNPQVIRTAEMIDISLIVFVRGRIPTKDIVKMAVEKNICILATKCIMYEACGRLYEAGLPPCVRL